MSMTTLKWPDYIILVAFLVISIGIGVYHSLTGGRQRTTQEFIMANRHLGIVPTTISLFISFQSAIVILGMTAEMYMYGSMFFVWAAAGYSIGIIITERLIVPWIYPLKLVSINDYLERRYASKAVRILGVVFNVMTAVLMVGVAMYAPSVALESATGLPTSVSIPLMAVVSVTYTVLGGMRAVIWTDVFQFGAVIGGVLAITIKGLLAVGGISKAVEFCRQANRLKLSDWNFDPTVRHTSWGLIFGFSFIWMHIYGLSQASVQRYSATATLAKAKIVVLLNVPAVGLLHLMTCLSGLAAVAYYSMIRCDPLANGEVSTPNQILSLFVTTIFADTHGFAGLFLATLYGGALSTVSSYLSGAAANIWEDILKIWLHAISDFRQVLINRFLVILFGSIATGVAFLAGVTPVPLTQLSNVIVGSVYGPLLGMFILGGISRHGNWKGAIIGGIVGHVINLWVTIGALSLGIKYPTLPPTSIEGCPSMWNVTSFNDTSLDIDRWLNETSVESDIRNIGLPLQNTSEPTGLAKFYSLSYVWSALFGATNTVIVGLLASLILRDRKAEEQVDDCLLIPFRACLRWRCSDESSPDEHKDRQYSPVDSSGVTVVSGVNGDQDEFSKGNGDTRLQSTPGRASSA